MYKSIARYCIHTSVAIICASIFSSPSFSEDGSSQHLIESIDGRALEITGCADQLHQPLSCADLLNEIRDLHADQFLKSSIESHRSATEGDLCAGTSNSDLLAIESNDIRGTPNGPFEIYNTSEASKAWTASEILTADGYTITNDYAGGSDNNPLRPKWKSYWLVKRGNECKPILLAALYLGDVYPDRFSGGPPDGVIEIQGRLFILSIKEIGKNSGTFGGELYVLPEDPAAYERCCSLIMTFSTH